MSAWKGLWRGKHNVIFFWKYHRILNNNNCKQYKIMQSPSLKIITCSYVYTTVYLYIQCIFTNFPQCVIRHKTILHSVSPPRTFWTWTFLLLAHFQISQCDNLNIFLAQGLRSQYILHRLFLSTDQRRVLTVPDFTISVYSGSCNSLLGIQIKQKEKEKKQDGRRKRDNIMNCRTQVNMYSRPHGKPSHSGS